jgi:hypothetical protein
MLALFSTAIAGLLSLTLAGFLSPGLHTLCLLSRTPSGLLGARTAPFSCLGAPLPGPGAGSSSPQDRCRPGLAPRPAPAIAGSPRQQG